MESIFIPSFPDRNMLDTTEVAADAAKGSNTTKFGNLAEVKVGHKWLLGSPGADKIEIVTVQSINPTTNIVTWVENLQNPHFKDEMATHLFGDQFILNRAPNTNGSTPIDDNYNPIGAVIPISVGEPTTYAADSNGGSGFWYKVTIYNSSTGEETPLSEVEGVRGGGDGHYLGIDEVKRAAGLKNNKWILTNEYVDAIDDAESEVKGALVIAGYTLPLEAGKIPYVVRNAAKLLAAGYVLISHPSPLNQKVTQDGEEKIAQANRILEGIRNGTIALVGPGDVATDVGDTIGGANSGGINSNECNPIMFHHDDKF